MSLQPHVDALVAALHGWYAQRAECPAEVEWPAEVVDLGNRHGLLPVLHAQSKGTQLAGWHRQNTFRMLGLASELVRLSTAFRQQGIPVLALKGPAMAQALYGDFSFRQTSDVDLIVPPGAAPAALDFLHSQGYVLKLPIGHLPASAIVACNTEVPLAHPGRGVEVDLHWGIAPRHSPHWVDPAFLWRQPGSVTLCGRQVPVPAPEALFIFLAVHGARHVWERLIWAVDIAMLLSRNPRIDWTWISDFSAAHSLHSVIALALEVAHRATGCAPPPAANPLTDRAARLVTAAWAAPDAPGTRDTLPLTQLLTPSRFRFGVHLLGLAASPTENDWRIAHLPAAWTPLYSVLRAGRLLRRALTISNSLERQPL